MFLSSEEFSTLQLQFKLLGTHILSNIARHSPFQNNILSNVLQKRKCKWIIMKFILVKFCKLRIIALLKDCALQQKCSHYHTLDSDLILQMFSCPFVWGKGVECFLSSDFFYFDQLWRYTLELWCIRVNLTSEKLTWNAVKKDFIAPFLAIILPCFNITVRTNRDVGVTLAIVSLWVTTTSSVLLWWRRSDTQWVVTLEISNTEDERGPFLVFAPVISHWLKGK